jgi:RNA polymerase sigma-70 factor (ECF subfamily)
MSFEAVPSDSSTAIPIQPWMKAGPASDEQLLARIAEGDLGAFQTFHDRYAARVAAYARQLGRDRHLEEDIVQEVFTAVWTRAASFNPARGPEPGNAAGWLYAFTRNKVIDLWRRSSKGGPAEEIDDRRLAARREEDDLRLTLRQALSRVPPEQRQAIEMAYFDGLTYQETAHELDLPEGTLKSRIRLGLRTLRSVLTQGRRAAN